MLYGVGLWRNIRNDWGCFSNLVSYRVGDGSHLHFWQDVWCGEATLEFLFPEIYSITQDKEALVSDYWDSFGSYIHWNLNFLRVL